MLSTIELKAIVVALVLLAAAAGGFSLAHRLDAAAYANLKLSYAQAQATAVAAAQVEQQRLDSLATAAARAEAVNQSRIAADAQAALAEVQAHVKVVPGHCVSWGLIRLLDSASRGTAAAGLPLPTGATDASCSSVDAVALARSVVSNYFTARANAEQLNALIANLREMHK